LRPEEKCLVAILVVQAGNVDGTADGVAEVVFLVLGDRVTGVEIIVGVEGIVAQELVGVAVEGVCPRLGFNFDRTGTIAAVLGAVIRSKNLHFSDGFQAGVDVHAGVGAVVEVVAAVQFPVVVFRATAVDAVGHVPVHTDLGFVLPGLVGHSGGKR